MTVTDLLFVIIILLITKREDRFWTLVGAFVAIGAFNYSAVLGTFLFIFVFVFGFVGAHLKDRKAMPNVPPSA